MAFSFCAYASWTVLAAFMCRAVVRRSPSETAPGVRFAASVAFLAALGVFFFLPPGSLPPFCNMPWSGTACVGLLLVSHAASRRGDALFPCLVFAAVYAVFCWYAYYRGMPGSFTNLGTLAAMPVWTIASPLEMAGFALMTPVFLVALRRTCPGPENGCGMPEFLTFLAAAALFVTLFVPWNLAPHVRWSAMPAAGADFLLFWLKIMLCCGIAFHIPSPSCILMSIASATGAAGAALILLSTAAWQTLAASVPLW